MEFVKSDAPEDRVQADINATAPWVIAEIRRRVLEEAAIAAEKYQVGGRHTQTRTAQVIALEIRQLAKKAIPATFLLR